MEVLEAIKIIPVLVCVKLVSLIINKTSVTYAHFAFATLLHFNTRCTFKSLFPAVFLNTMFSFIDLHLFFINSMQEV